VGSPTDEFSFCLNLFYASSFDVKAHPQFQHKWAVVRPEDKKWTFTQDLTNVVQTDTGKLIKNSEVEWFNLPNAMAVISTEIRPVLVVPHLFCLDGTTKFRSLMELMDIPFIGSSSQRTVLATNKTMTRSMMIECGIPCPPGKIIFEDTIFNSDDIEYPCVVKPTTTENSVGMSLVKSPEGLDLAVKTAFTHSSNVIIDKFIAGRELRCSVVEVVDQSGNVELIPMAPQEYHVSKVDIRKFDDKLVVDENGLPVGKAPSTKTSFICEEKEPVLYEKIQKLALKVHRCLQFKDFSMIDIRVDSEGNPFVLEVNLFCSFGAQSVLSAHTEKFGWTNEKLFQTMVDNNFRRLL